MRRLVAAIDQGTSSSRCVVYEASAGQLRAVGSGQRELRAAAGREGQELDCEQLVESVVQCVQDAMSAAHCTAQEVLCVGIATQRESTVLWDTSTGVPLCPALLWSDTRAASLTAALTAQHGRDALRSLTGLPLSPYFSAAKLSWALQTLPLAAETAARGHLAFGTVDAFLLHRLTGRHVTDVTNASRTQLMDVRTLQWSDSALAFFGLQTARLVLPAIVPSCSASAFGVMTSGPLKGVPVTCVLGDQQAALLGQGCQASGLSKATYGTGCFALLHTGPRILPSTRLLTTVAMQVEGHAPDYALEGAVACAGSVVGWLREMQLIDGYEDLETCGDDSAGVTLVPAFQGLLSPQYRSDARGTITGMTLGTKRQHIVRAALEGIAHQTADVLDAMAVDSGHPIASLKVDGGLSQSKSLMQLVARYCGIPVLLREDKEATAAGAAIGALRGLGEVIVLDKVQETWKTFTPDITEEERQKLRAKWAKEVLKSYNDE